MFSPSLVNYNQHVSFFQVFYNVNCSRYLIERVQKRKNGTKKEKIRNQKRENTHIKTDSRHLSSKYNCIDIDSIDKYSIVFLHFTASPKPWHLAWFVNRQCNKFIANLYQEYEKKTPWANIPLVLPRDYKEMEYFSKDLRKAGKYIMSLKWYIKYLIKKIIR